jgi:pyruvate/2-oxoglutarate dehydrogenase complex dihydrolipoamide dehydrogenase (E3) component
MGLAFSRMAKWTSCHDKQIMINPLLQPDDEFNSKLALHVRPANWINPTPASRYNLVVIGAGTAGLVTAAGAAGLGAKVALIECALMGGDCLNVGCVPSKSLISAGRMAASVRRSSEFGIDFAGRPAVNFAAVMRRMRRSRTHISANDSAERFRRLGVDVFFGSARFADSNSVEVEGQRLNFKRAVIASGGRPAIPQIPGLTNVEYLTNETIFSLVELPRRMGVIGAGPIGCELAQAFAQFGAEVYLVEAEHGVLPREDRDAAEIVQRAMERDGVRLMCCGKQLQIENSSNTPRLVVQSHDKSFDQPVDQLLLSVGRMPNVEGLNLESVGVTCNATGVVVNDRLQTTNPMIYAAGDVCSPYQFTHAADFMARIVIQNALFRGRKKFSALVMPWCTYTTPEIAHVGFYEHQAREDGVEVQTLTHKFDEVDRAILDGETEGFVKVHLKKGTDRIVGATIVGSRAGEMISEITLAMTHRIGLKKIATTIHPYPTMAEAIRKLGDQFNRTRLTPLVHSVFRKWLHWTR